MFLRFLGYVDMLGTNFEEKYVCTGFAQYLALPIIRKDYREDMTIEEAKNLVEKYSAKC